MTVLMAYNSISRWSGALGVCAIVAIIRPAHADPRAVVELFTSQGCSSCPPADKIIGELAKDPNVIALSMPIDYWDYLGWKDTLADSRFSARQKAYSQIARRSQRLHAAGRRQRIGAGDRQRSRQDRRRDRRYREGRRRDVGAGIDLAGRQAGHRFGRGLDQRSRRVARRSLDLFGHEGSADLDRARARIAARRSPTTMWCATCSRSATGTAPPAAGPCRWKISPAKASMPRWCLSRTAIAKSPARCWARPTRRCTEIPIPSFRGSAHRASDAACAHPKIHQSTILRIRVRACHRVAHRADRLAPSSNDTHPPKEKGPTFVGPVWG